MIDKLEHLLAIGLAIALNVLAYCAVYRIVIKGGW